MAEDRQVTPEKQLLKLIEEVNTATTKGTAAVQKERIKRTSRGLMSLPSLRGALFGWLSFFKRAHVKRVNRAKFSISFKAVNRLLILASVGLVIYLAADTFALGISLMHPPNFVMQKSEKLPPPPAEQRPLKDEADYVEKASSRNIFKEFKEAAPKKAEKTAAPAASNGAVQGLTLVGISWSANPDAIVEDKDKQKTYFLKRGMSFGDGMKVTSIFKDRVVVSNGDEEYEIK